MRRREFIAGLGSVAALGLSAQAQTAQPVVGFVSARSSADDARYGGAFRLGLSETGIDGQRVTVEYHWLDGRYDSLPSLMADLVRRHVAVIATTGGTAALAAKAATVDIPIVFGVNENPVSLGLVASLARPGGNVTGVNVLGQEAVAKQLELLHMLVPKAVRVAVLVNPANAANTETTLRAAPDAARALGLEIQVLSPRLSENQTNSGTPGRLGQLRQRNASCRHALAVEASMIPLGSKTLI